jgi:hypothetical protein
MNSDDRYFYLSPIDEKSLVTTIFLFVFLMCFQKERSVLILQNEFRTVGILWAELPGGV